MSRKDTIEAMRRLAEARGGHCLSVEYVNQRTPLRWACAEGHVWDAAPSMVKGSQKRLGTWCRICATRVSAQKRMSSPEEMQRLAEEHGGSFASSEYLGSQVKHRWKCSQYPRHPEFAMIPNAVQQGQWCPECSGNAAPTFEVLSDLARGKHPSARCLSTDYKNSSTPLQWQCGVDGHPPFSLSYRSVKHDGSWCELCRRERPRPKKYDRDMLARFAASIGGALISEHAYRSTKQTHQWQCADGHQFTRSLDSILSGRSFCPKCAARRGVREEYVRELFTHMFGMPFERTRALPWLCNPRGNFMELDGYCADLALAFEHNGQQHYDLDGYFTRHPGQLRARLADDEQKVRLCRENGVLLVVVPFTIPLKDIHAYLLRELAGAGVEPRTRTSIEPGLFAPSKMERLRQHASRLGGRLLSERYQGSASKLRWQCRNPAHPAFEMAPSTVMGSGHWCRRCADEKRAESYRVSAQQVEAWAAAARGALMRDEHVPPGTEKKLALSDEALFRCLSCGRVQRRSIQQVKNGRLCLCHTGKTRIDRQGIEVKLAGGAMRIVAPSEVLGGRTRVTLECRGCGTQWRAKASGVMNDTVGCPHCRSNARINTEKARALGERLGFHLRSSDVLSGSALLEWECRHCGAKVEKPYREMRSLRRCRACVQAEAERRLQIK